MGVAANSLLAEVKAYHRAYLEQRMDQVVDLVEWMAEVVGMMGND